MAQAQGRQPLPSNVRRTTSTTTAADWAAACCADLENHTRGGPAVRSSRLCPPRCSSASSSPPACLTWQSSPLWSAVGCASFAVTAAASLAHPTWRTHAPHRDPLAWAASQQRQEAKRQRLPEHVRTVARRASSLCVEPRTPLTTTTRTEVARRRPLGPLAVVLGPSLRVLDRRMSKKCCCSSCPMKKNVRKKNNGDPREKKRKRARWYREPQIESRRRRWGRAVVLAR